MTLERLGIKIYFISINLWVSWENFIIFLEIACQIDAKVLFLTGKSQLWRPVLVGVPQDSILGPVLFPIYINDSPNNLKFNAKLFANETFLQSLRIKMKVPIFSKMTSKWYFSWKWFNPDPYKPAQEVLFSRKKKLNSIRP